MEDNQSYRFAVMGNPIAHSLSPFIHHRFAKQKGIKLRYEKIQVIEENFASQVDDFFSQGGRGLNITLPLKQKAFAIAYSSTPRCKQAKSANTLWLKNGKLHADNTDGIGLIHDLSRYLELKGKQVLLLGAGGASRGIIGPLLAAGIAQLTVANRTEETALNLQIDFAPITCTPLADLKKTYDLILNATSASLAGERIALARILLKPTTLCYDLAYSTNGLTPFVEWARKQGSLGIDGLGMLVEQAAESFFIWHGIRPDTPPVLTELRSTGAPYTG